MTAASARNAHPGQGRGRHATANADCAAPRGQSPRDRRGLREQPKSAKAERRDESDGHRRDASLRPNALGIGDLVAFGSTDHLGGCAFAESAGGTIHDIDPCIFQTRCQCHEIVERPASGLVVDTGEPHHQRPVGWPSRADRAHYLQEEACPSVEIATPTVTAVIGEGRKETVNQVTVGGVNVEYAKARLRGARRCRCVIIEQALDPVGIECLWDVPATIGRNGARRRPSSRAHRPSRPSWRQAANSRPKAARRCPCGRHG